MIAGNLSSWPVPRRQQRPRARPLSPRRWGSSGQSRHSRSMPTERCSTFFRSLRCASSYSRAKAPPLAQTWRVKQLQYSLMRSLMGRHRDFWGLTEDGLIWASKNLKLDLTDDKKKQLMDAYLTLAAFPDVKPGLEALKKQGLKLAILSNGEPKMLEAAVKSAGIRDLLDEIISVEEVKIFKTSHRVYWLATERLKVSNPQLGFVSANNWDGVAAVSAGLRTFWIQRSTAEVPEELGFQVDTTVKAITDLPALLRG